VAGLLAHASVDLVVVSTDLSHYLDIHAARAADRRTADAIVRRDAEAVGPDDACGVYALRGALTAARMTERPIVELDLRTSGDTVGDPDRVVGYGAFALVDRP
jgi:AmmeMemoRadiSam system protein B